ncbi:antA/AntB antirepressor family protein [Actinobacillus pleuropneumoniae]|uniref:antA/AntB antirepressor family protein n=1 Tax=Actinobacillus pleuropneumoniae TaxID=715 RepID=UPI003B0199AA
MTNFQIKTFTGSLQNQSIQLINARELHERLQSKQHFSDWIKKRIADYGFEENLDFIGVHTTMITEAGFFGKREKEIKDYHITLDMAKELCMLERSELGQKARRYFIQMEKEALKAHQSAPTLPPVNHNAVQLTKDRYIELLENENQLLKSKSIRQAKRPNIPLSAIEKHQILQLAEQGITKAEIATRLNRSKSAVRSVIRENGEV